MDNETNEVPALPFTIPLEEPVAVGKSDKTISELVITAKPKAGHFRKAEQLAGANAGKVGLTLALVSLLTKQPMTVIDQLSMVDVEAVSDAIAPFLPASQRTGEG